MSTKDENKEEEYSQSNKNKRSLSTPSTPEVKSKKIRLLDDHEEEEEEEEEQLPLYLQIPNVSFNKMMMDTGSFMPITEEDLQELAILKHKIGVMNIGRQLWTVYLKSGTGQWETTSVSRQTTVDRRLWPKQVKKIMESKLNVNDQNEQQLCEDIVHEHLQQLNKTIEQYQNEYENKKISSLGFTKELEKAIELFVQQYGMQSYEIKLNYKIALLKYDYDLQILERDYLQQKPTKYQVK